MKKQVINNDSLKKALPYGAIKTIANRSEVSIYTVSNVINKGGKNPKVLKVIREYLEEMHENNNQIYALISQA